MRETLKLALEALEEPLAPTKRLKAITAIKEALAQPEQEPVAYQDTADKCLLETVPAKGTLLHATPPQRTWVGLTYEDMVSLQKYLHDDQGEIVLPTTFAQAVEAKLKEKNT